jgi:tetratricopeptide (TPR) repeat protein
VNLRRLAMGAAVLSLLAWGTAAEARNPHCAGGIQYVVGGLRDKEKGNTEDYLRQMNKAVAQLEQCASEDPEDAEALGYLGWAYAEIDSSCQAGKAFAAAIAKLKAKGDPKKAEWATNNRDSYWANAFNDGIGKINAAQSAYPDYAKNPENDADKTLKQEAGKRYQEAITSLNRAACLRPNHPQTVRNLGSVYVFMGDFKKATEIYNAGLAAVPNDSSLVAGLKAARTGYANQLLEDKKYDEAVAFFQDLLKTDPNNADLWSSVADARFQQAQKDTSKAGKTSYFKAAGDAYAKSFSLKSDNADVAFNAALSYQNAGEPVLSEAQWRNALKLKPNDVDALSSLAAVLAEQKKYDDASKLLLQALAANPQNKTLHRQLGGVYTRGGYNAKANEELMVFLAMQNGQPAPDAAAAVKGNEAAGAAGPKALASNGTPDQVIPWEASGEKYSSWFYWTKKQALHFKGGVLIVTSDWGGGPAPSTTSKK